LLEALQELYRCQTAAPETALESTPTACQWEHLVVVGARQQLVVLLALVGWADSREEEAAVVEHRKTV
jgi:hypothetical protein